MDRAWAAVLFKAPFSCTISVEDHCFRGLLFAIVKDTRNCFFKSVMDFKTEKKKRTILEWHKSDLSSYPKEAVVLRL